VTWSSYGITVT